MLTIVFNFCGVGGGGAEGGGTYWTKVQMALN